MEHGRAASRRPFALQGGLHVQEDAGEPHLERAPTQNSTVVDTWNCRGSPIATYRRLALDG